MHQPPRRAALLTLAATASLAAVLLLSCGQDSGGVEVTGFGLTPLELSIEGRPVERDAAVATPIPLPTEEGVWQIDAPVGRFAMVKPRGGGPLVNELQLIGKTAKTVVIPGPFEAGAFTRVVVEARIFDSQVLRAQLLRDGAPLLSSSPEPVAAAPGTQTILLDLPHVRALRGEVDALAIVVQGRGACSIRRVALVDQHIEHWLPGAGEDPDQVDISGEARLARGLTSAAPLVGSFVAPSRGVLAFSYGVPELLHYPGAQPAVLRVDLRADDGTELSERFPLDDPPNTPRWRGARIELGALAGEAVQARFVLEAPGEALAVCAIGEGRVFVPGPPAPTVLLITSDTHRADYVGGSGSGVGVRTPVIDALAARGVFFEDCFTATNITNPSHIALMTAVHPRDTGILVNNAPLSRQAPTLAERFRAAGYMTAAIVSTRHLGDDVSGLGQGFYRMSWPRNMGERDVAESLRLLERWLRQLDDVPLFVWLHLFDAHTPYDPPEELARSYYPSEADPFDPARPTPLEPPAENLPSFLEGLKDPAWPEAMYRAEISHLDGELARVLDQDRIRAGIVAFTADHGESLGQHGIYYDHADLYPDTIHVPLVLAWPDGPRGVRVKVPVAHTDIGRTLLDLAGLESAEFPGLSLLDALSPEPSSAPRFAIAGNRTSASMTWRGWHLILHLREHAEKIRREGAALHQVELYRLDEDPGCLDDRLEAEPEQAKLMRARLVQWLAGARDLGWALERRLDPELLSALAELGYADDEGGSAGLDYFDPECDCDWCQRFE